MTSLGQFPYTTTFQLPIQNLTVSTDYIVSIILVNADGNWYDGPNVPVGHFVTNCADITHNHLSIQVENSSITVGINKTKEICSFEMYDIKIYRERTRIQNANGVKEENLFPNLQPDTEYTISITKSDQAVLNQTVRTNQGIPNIVEKIKWDSTNSSVQINWNAPREKNGNITGYGIEYKVVSYGVCDEQTHPSKTKNVSTNAVTIDNLSAYSRYEVTIWAITIYNGRPTTTQFHTKETSEPSFLEFPSPTFAISKPNTIIITNHWICTQLEGPLKYSTEFSCNNEWCQSTVTSEMADITNTSLKSTVYYYHTIGYTNYNYRIYIYRNDKHIFQDYNITTPVTAPNRVRNATVYSKNNTSISLRWLPPYPPTGEIDYYIITAFNGNTRVNKTSACKLWPEHICAIFSGLYPKSYHQFQIRAKNINETEFGLAQHIGNVLTQEQRPEPPLNFTLEWDDRYELIISWCHPDISNGKLLQFLIWVNDEAQSPYIIHTEQLRYNYKLDLQNLTGQKLRIAVAAKNSAAASTKVGDSTYSPPATPRLTSNPNIEDVKNTTFNIVIPRILNLEGNTSYMYIIITDIRRTILHDYLHPRAKHLMEVINVKSDNSWIVREFDLKDLEKQDGFTVEIGNGDQSTSKVETDWEFKNRKLETGTTYDVSIILINTFMGISRHGTYVLNCTVLAGETSSFSPLLGLLVLPVILCIFCIMLIKRKKGKVNSTIYATFQHLGMARGQSDVPMRPLLLETNYAASQNPIAKPSIKKEVPAITEDEQKYSKSVKISDLEKYIKQAVETEEFEKQHGVFPRGQTKPWTYGTEPQNKAKNRYTNLAAYDHSRVKLGIINGDPFSDYINANYIDGYRSQKNYIATQGPKISTLNDFWRMIWQEKVEHIIMIANITEGGKRKVEKYWPEINKCKEFDNIKVKYVKVEVQANFEVRYLDVSCGDEQRKVEQLHFLTWPDHGVPLYAQSLAPFLKKMLTIPYGRAPIVVHCSAGVGRTGSLILCDICLRMAAREGRIDAFHYLHKIREQRVNMVDNVEQYKLVHLVLLQCLVAPEMAVLCNEHMEKHIDIILSTKIQEEMKYLVETSWQDEAMRSAYITTDLPIVHSKNRYQHITPEPSSRISLSPYPSTDETSTYINAITVDAFSMRSKFIITQDPLSNTVGDFWRLIEEKEITTVICLNELDLQEKTTCKFYPRSSGHTMKPVPYLEIKYTGKEVNAYYKVYSITMSRLDDQGNDKHIKIMHFNNWHSSMLHPENPVDLLIGYEEMNRLGVTSDTILITCHDGATACGLFVAMCFVIDKIKMEQLCDVCLAVRTVRHSRKEFIKQAEQFAFLYKCGLDYVRQFDMYSNFSLKH